ncbi:MAG: ATP-binding protein [Pseudomonadota bacterium]
MLYRKERQAAASLSALMAQTRDAMVCFTFRRPVDPTEPRDIVNAKLRDATVVEASTPFARYFGFERREDVLGQHLLKLFGGSIPEWFVDYGQEVEDRNFEDIERIIQIPVKDRMRTMRIYMQNIFTDDLLTSQWIIIRDISRESEQERVIEENERLKTLAVQAVGLRTFALEFDPADRQNPHGRMAVDKTGYPGWWGRVIAEDQPLLESAFADFYQGRSEQLHTMFRAKDESDELVWLESWAVASDRDAKGLPQGIVGVVLDRTHGKILEEKMIASQRLESLGVMAGGIAHDFNNMLMPIIGMLDVLADSNPQMQEDFQTMDSAARRAAQLCEQLLTYAGRGSAELTSLNISETLADVKDLLAVSTHAKCQIDFDLGNGCWVKGDAAQITQVLLNLVKNASDALEGEAGNVTVTLSKRDYKADWSSEFHNGSELRPGRYVSLTVTDTGKGVPSEEVERLFDPFLTTKFTGRGLGLAVVMGVIRGHDGGVRVDSTRGQGTTIEVVLRAEEAEPEEAPQPVADPLVKLSGRVLVVDDEEPVRNIAARLLKSLGLRTELAVDGQAAIQQVQENPDSFDVVLLDVSMPGIDGVEAANQILHQHPDTQIVLCTGYSYVAIPDKLAASVGFLQKPYRLEQLRAKLTPLLV